MAITREELVTQLKAKGFDAELVTPEPPFPGVNVWADPGDRHPWSTVWFPMDPEIDQSRNATDFVWGPSFQYRAEPDVSAAELADSVVETMKASV